MGQEILVSVIMPAYRCADTIRQAVDSALAQGVPLEVIVLNDQSPDDLDSVMKQYAEDLRVRYLHNEENLGAAASRNRGVRMAVCRISGCRRLVDSREAACSACADAAGKSGALLYGQRTCDTGRTTDRTGNRSPGADHISYASSAQLH